jgi:hypothetical protein
MNFWAKLLDTVVNIFIFLGTTGVILRGLFMMTFNVLTGLLTIVIGIFVVLLSASFTKVLLHASEDLALCRQYLSRAGSNNTEKTFTKLSEISNASYKKWKCEACKYKNEGAGNFCVGCGQKKNT